MTAKHELALAAAAQAGAISVALHAVSENVETVVSRVYGETAADEVKQARVALEALLKTMRGFT